MASQRKSRPENESSILLSNHENKKLYSLIGTRCVTLATGVVQLFLAEGPSCNRWNKRCCGVVTFIKDNALRSYFIRVYDILNCKMLWEQELYNQFKYKTPRPYFHTFETDDCPAGLNFSNEKEAANFLKAVQTKLQERQQRKIERKRSVHPSTMSPRAATQPPVGQKTLEPAGPPVGAAITSTPAATLADLSHSSPPLPDFTVNKDQGKGTLKGKKNKDKKKSKLSKDMIGTPSNFRHVGHIGWDPDKGFDMNQLDPSLKALFDQVGISENQLQDKETATFIYDFIEKQGGLDAIKREQQSRPLPPPPPGHGSSAPPPPPAMTRAPPLPSRGNTAPPPPPPSRGSGGPPPPPPPSRSNLPPPPPARTPRGATTAPPPPMPFSRGGPPPPMPPTAPLAPSRQMVAPPPPPPVSSPAVPPPPPPGGAAPPPPPPPPVAAAAPPPPPVPSAGGPLSPPTGAPTTDGGRNMLLEAIRNKGGTSGAGLKHVDPDAQSTSSNGSGRNALLDQIRQGISLKNVENTTPSERPPSGEDAGGIAAALAKALATRSKNIQHSDDDNDDDDDVDDDDEWDD